MGPSRTTSRLFNVGSRLIPQRIAGFEARAHHVGCGAGRVAVGLRTSPPAARTLATERALAEGLLADAETRVMYGQSTDQLDWTRDTLRLTGTETELLLNLDRGVALWKVGQRSFIVRHRRSRAEEPLTNTDARMTVRAGQ